MSKIGMKIGHRRDVTVEVDPKTRLTEMGVSEDKEEATKKWGPGEARDGDLEFPSTRDHDGNHPEGEEFVDPSFFRVDITINGRVFKLAADQILRLRAGEIEQGVSVDQQLEACSYYRFSLFSAALQVRKRRTSMDQDFRRWLAQVRRKHRKELARSRKRAREDLSLTTKDQSNITKDDLIDSILADDEDGQVYAKFEDEINELRRSEDLLIELRDCMHDRGFHLGGIAERAHQHVKKPDFT